MARRSRQGPSTTDFILAKRNYSFQGEIDKQVANTKKRMLMVMKQSLLIAVNEMQTPVSKGGKMRVDTGFLRASIQVSLNGVPGGPNASFNGTDTKPKGSTPGQFDDGNRKYPQIEVTIGKMKFGSNLYVTWTANYAKYREAHDGFVYSTIQRWQQIVDAVVAEAKRRFP